MFIFTNLTNIVDVVHVSPTDPVPPEGDPSEDAPVSRGRPHTYLQIYSILDVLHVHDIQMNFTVSVRNESTTNYD